MSKRNSEIVAIEVRDLMLILLSSVHARIQELSGIIYSTRSLSVQFINGIGILRAAYESSGRAGLGPKRMKKIEDLVASEGGDYSLIDGSFVPESAEEAFAAAELYVAGRLGEAISDINDELGDLMSTPLFRPGPDDEERACEEAGEMILSHLQECLMASLLNLEAAAIRHISDIRPGEALRFSGFHVPAPGILIIFAAKPGDFETPPTLPKAHGGLSAEMRAGWLKQIASKALEECSLKPAGMPAADLGASSYSSFLAGG